ncbi:MAG: SDR family NAD(P)-dependent oxidoreductase [Dehalococcoidia bacterium]
MADQLLSGKVAIVTGSSRGIGEAIAKSLAGAGARVLIAARTEHETDPRLPGTIHSVAAAIRAAGGNALPVVLNLRDAESIQACVDAARPEFGRLDIVVNNAAVMPPGNIETVQDRHLDLMWQVDLRGPILMCKAAIPLMKAGGGGHIINVSSNLASMPGPGPYDDADRSKGGIFYSTLKAGLDRFTQGLAQDLARYSIAANVLMPTSMVSPSTTPTTVAGCLALWQASNSGWPAGTVPPLKSVSNDSLATADASGM